MTIGFKQIPSNLRVPLFYAEVDNSQANTANSNQRALIIGQITSAGTATPNVPVISQGISDAKTLGGQGSMLAQMTYTYRQNDNFGEVWYLPLADDPSAITATGSIAFTAAATANGTLSLYIGGILVTTVITSTQTTAQIATAVAAAINAINDLAVTATASTTTVTITAKNKGLAGNDIDIRVNYRGVPGGEVTPTGLAFTITPMASGATNPSLTTGLANLQSMPFDFIVCPYTDTTSLTSLQSFLNDTTGRWSWSVQVYGHCFFAYRGTSSALTTFGLTRNNQHESCMGFYDSPTPVWKWAAAFAAASAVSLRADPGVPLQTVVLNDVLAPPLASQFSLSQRNTNLYDGISTFTVGTDGTVRIENAITTYQTNAFGQPDNSYLEVETMFLLAFVLRSLATVVTSKYARVKLAADGTRFAPGSNIVTPSVIKADIIAQYQTLEYNGFVQKSQQFAQGLIVQQNASNPNRVDVLWPGVLINQLRIFALLAQFRLS
ncbi:phage tail sheath subtilisin-like domain-containing protein [Burkholderia pseudomallei]|uniref:phage tail sheath subtilisin-like domain-containing protein n=1 Tax=Burkholderia pseudomallei TaxID=28450 RepID=UPI000A1A1348|nr:phage tail sheath subtilisin-like domain-containing protein [Burkholderia pseudomallei]ARK86043.1 phage tail protein [Burkholderia pseudomallei]